MPTQSSSKVSHHIIERLMAKLRDMGVAHFYYAIVPTEQSELIQNMGHRTKFYFGNISSQQKMRFAVVSDDKILRFRDEFLDLFSKLDPRFLYSIPPNYNETHPVFFPQKALPKQYNKRLEHLRSKIGINGSAATYHYLDGKEGWIGMFHLFSQEGSDAFKLSLQPIEHELFSLLQEYSAIFVAHAQQEINPISNFGMLSSNCIKILGMVAEGDSSEEIGKKLFLTERGVNYHIDRAREILGARNRTNLVSKAYKKGVL